MNLKAPLLGGAFSWTKQSQIIEQNPKIWPCKPVRGFLSKISKIVGVSTLSQRALGVFSELGFGGERHIAVLVGRVFRRGGTFPGFSIGVTRTGFLSSLSKPDTVSM
ncbi:MAG: hypothetical protein JSS51_06025 [Planctomycetes bacterium]|nr:hypothetical protein [Planctomycetota bacterium]